MDAPEGNCPTCLIALLTKGFPDYPGLNPTSPSSEDRFVGRHFADYEIESRIAEGGMGVVYAATQVSLNRRVALKTIGAGLLATHAQVERFRFEAEAAAKLSHPNIVPIYEVGVHEGHHFYSMELIEGKSLAALLREQDPRFNGKSTESLREAARLVAIAARAVHHAHERGVLHRDLKPENLLVDSNGSPHITDFGLAKLLQQDSSLTQEMSTLGTPAYMAPEQARGGGTPLTTAVDIYSLGAVLYELLTGSRPFESESLADLMRKVVESAPVPLSQKAPHIPRDLEIVCLTCLAKEPHRRYRSALALAEDLEAWLEGKTIRARPSSPAEKLWRWGCRQPLLATLAGCTLGLLLILGIGSPIALLRIQREREAARRAEAQALDKLAESYVSQARATRRSGRAGQRAEALEALRSASLLPRSFPPSTLRTERIASLALVDLHWTNVVPVPSQDSLVLYSPDLDAYAVDSLEGVITIHETATGREFSRLPALYGPVKWFAGFTQNPKTLAVAYWSGAIAIWDVNTSSPVLQDPHGKQISSISFTAGDEVVVAQKDRTLHFYSPQDFQEIRTLETRAAYSGLVVDALGKWAAGFNSHTSELETIDLISGQVRRSLNSSKKIVICAWSPHEPLLAVGCDDGSLLLWRTDRDDATDKIEAHDDRISALTFSKDGRFLVTSGWDGQVRLWDVRSHVRLLTTPGNASNLHFNRSGTQLASAMRGALSGRFSMTQSSIFRLLPAPRSTFRGAWALAISPDGRWVAAGTSQGIRLWELSTGEELGISENGNWRGVTFTQDGKGLLSSGGSSLIEWDFDGSIQTNSVEGLLQNRRVIREHSGLRFEGVALGQDGKWVFAANNAAGSIGVYDRLNPTNRFPLTEHPGVAYVTVTSNGQWLASGTWKGTGVKIWDLHKRALDRELSVNGTARVLFSPNDQWLAVASSEGYRAWDTSTWRPGARLGEASAGAAMAFSPDSTLFAGVNASAQIELRRPDTGELLTQLEAPNPAMIAALRFTRDGTQLLALQGDQQVQVWNLKEIRRDLSTNGLDWASPPEKSL